MEKRTYKDLNVYSCIVLNMLSSALGIDLQQKDLEKKLSEMLRDSDVCLTKSEVMHAIRSNHNMTERILSHLVDEGYVKVERDQRGYRVLPTEKGLLHVREFNRFYASVYSKQIEDHYRYTGLPAWYVEYK